MAITEAGRAHMAQLAAERAARVEQVGQERLREDLGRIGVGWVVWSRHDKAVGGVVVETGADLSTGEKMVTCVRTRRASGGQWRWRSWRLALSDIGKAEPGTVDPEAWRQLFGCICDGDGPWSNADARLNHWAIALRDATPGVPVTPGE